MIQRNYTQRSIRYKGTKMWNALPLDLREIITSKVLLSLLID